MSTSEGGAMENHPVCPLESVPSTLPTKENEPRESVPLDSLTQMWSEEALRPGELPSESPCLDWSTVQEAAAGHPQCSTVINKERVEKQPGKCEWDVVQEKSEDTTSLSTSECGSLGGTQAEALQEVDNLHQGLRMGNAELGLGSIILTYDQKAAAKTMGHCLSSLEGKKALEGFDRLIWKSRKEMGLVDWEFENGTPDDDPDSLMIDSRNQDSADEANPFTGPRDQKEHDELVDDNPDKEICEHIEVHMNVDKSISTMCDVERASCQAKNQTLKQSEGHQDSIISNSIKDHSISCVISPYSQERAINGDTPDQTSALVVNDKNAVDSSIEYSPKRNANKSPAGDNLDDVRNKSVEVGVHKKPPMMTAWDVLQSNIEVGRSKIHTTVDVSTSANACLVESSYAGKQEAVNRHMIEETLNSAVPKTLSSFTRAPVAAARSSQHHANRVKELNPELDQTNPSSTTGPASTFAPSVKRNSRENARSTRPPKLMSSIQSVHSKGASIAPTCDGECEVDTVPDSDEEDYGLEESRGLDSENQCSTLATARRAGAGAQTPRGRVGARRRTDDERRAHSSRLLIRNQQKFTAVLGKYCSARGELCTGQSNALKVAKATCVGRDDMCKKSESCLDPQPVSSLKHIKQKSCVDNKPLKKAQCRDEAAGVQFYDIPASDSDVEGAVSPANLGEGKHREGDQYKHANMESPRFEKVSVRSDDHIDEAASVPCLRTPGRNPLEENLQQDSSRDKSCGAQRKVVGDALEAPPSYCAPLKGVPRMIPSKPSLNIFGGMTFVVTGFGRETEKIKSKIVHHGGVIIKSCGGPCPVIAHAQDTLPDIVVSTKTSRSSQYLACVARGCGAVTERWVEDCISAGVCVRTDPLLDHVSLPSRPHLRDCPLFMGYHVLVHGSGPIHAAICCVLRHSGAVVLQDLESENLPERIGASQAKFLHILVDGQSKIDEELRQSLSTSVFACHSSADVKSKNWVVESILKGELLKEDGPCQKRSRHLMSKKRPHQSKTMTENSKETRVQNDTSCPNSNGKGVASFSDEADELYLSQIQQPSKRPRLRGQDNVQQAHDLRNKQQKAPMARPSSAIEDNLLRTPSRAEGHCASQGRDFVSMPPTPDAVMSISLSGFNEGPNYTTQDPLNEKLCWVGLPLPTGQRGRHRAFYGGFLLEGVEIKVGDCVELYPSVGEEHYRVVKIEALWSEIPQDGCERKLARVRRFYLPEEVCVPIASVTGEVYSTNHIEERVPLQAIRRPCQVQILDTLESSREHTAKDGLGSSQVCYRCSLHYNQEEGTMEQTRLSCGVAISRKANPKADKLQLGG